MPTTASNHGQAEDMTTMPLQHVTARDSAADATTPRLLPRGQIEPVLATILGAALLPVCFYWLRFTWTWWRTSQPRSSLALIALAMWTVMTVDEGFIIAYAVAFDACTVPYYNATPPLSPALGACRAAYYFQATDQLQNLGACLLVVATTLRFAHVFAATSARRRARLAHVLVATAATVCAIRAVIIAAKQYVVDVGDHSVDPASVQTVLEVDVASMNAAYLVYGMLDLICLGMGARYIFRLSAEIQADMAALPRKQRGLRIPVPRLASLRATTQRLRHNSSSTRRSTPGSTSGASVTVEKPAAPLLLSARTRRAPTTGDLPAEIQATAPTAPSGSSPASSRRGTPHGDSSTSASATRARLEQLVRQLRLRLALCVGMLLVFIASSALADAIPAVLLNTVTTACLKLFAAGDMLAMTGLKRILMVQRGARHTGVTSGVSAGGGGMGRTARPSAFGTLANLAESGSGVSQLAAPTQQQE